MDHTRPFSFLTNIYHYTSHSKKIFIEATVATAKLLNEFAVCVLHLRITIAAYKTLNLLYHLIANRPPALRNFFIVSIVRT